MLKFHPYQENGVERARRLISKGVRRFILHAPTGAGKTVIASGMIQSALSKKKNVIFFAHRKELIDQGSEKLDQMDIPHGVIMSGHWRKRYAAGVQVASIQTWRSWVNKANKEKMPEYLEKYLSLSSTEIDWEMIPKEWRQHLFIKTFKPDLIFIDECHLSIAKSYMDMVDSFPKKAVLVGLTATPIRGDGLPLDDLYSEIVSISTPAKLIDQGYLVQPRHFAASIPDLKNVSLKKNEYDNEELASVMDRADLIGDLVTEWLNKAKGRPTLGFAVNRRHSKNICEEFINCGIRAEHLDGTNTKAEREAGLARLKSGETEVLFNVGIFTEGTDLPFVSCISLACPTKSLASYLQKVGRGLRTFGVEKNDCVILDHAGCFHEHGAADADREWSLKGKKKRRKKVEPPKPKVCPECSNTFSANLSKCPSCGWEPETSGFTLSVDTTKSLSEMSPSEIRMKLKKEEDEAKTLEALIELGKIRGYKEGWAHYRYEERQKKYLVMSRGNGRNGKNRQGVFAR